MRQTTAGSEVALMACSVHGSGTQPCRTHAV